MNYYLEQLERVKFFVNKKDYRSAKVEEYCMLKSLVFEILNKDSTYNEIEQAAALCVESFRLLFYKNVNNN